MSTLSKKVCTVFQKDFSTLNFIAFSWFHRAFNDQNLPSLSRFLQPMLSRLALPFLRRDSSYHAYIFGAKIQNLQFYVVVVCCLAVVVSDVLSAFAEGVAMLLPCRTAVLLL